MLVLTLITVEIYRIVLTLQNNDNQRKDNNPSIISATSAKEKDAPAKAKPDIRKRFADRYRIQPKQTPKPNVNGNKTNVNATQISFNHQAKQTPAKNGSVSNAVFIERVRTQSALGVNRLRILYCVPQQGTAMMVFFELFNTQRRESHWAFKADTFYELITIGKETQAFPLELTKVHYFSKRGVNNPEEKLIRKIKSSQAGSQNLELPENILGFAMNITTDENMIKNEVTNIVHKMLLNEFKEGYYIMRKERSSQRLADECEPNTGGMWKALKSSTDAKDTIIMIRMNYLNDIVYNDDAIRIIQTLYQNEWESEHAIQYAIDPMTDNN